MGQVALITILIICIVRKIVLFSRIIKKKILSNYNFNPPRDKQDKICHKLGRISLKVDTRQIVCNRKIVFRDKKMKLKI